MDINEIENDIDRLEAAESEYKLELGVIQSELDKLRNQKRALELAAIGLKPNDYLIVTPEFYAYDLPRNGHRAPKPGTIAGVRSLTDMGVYMEWIPNGLGVWTPEARVVRVGLVPLEYVSAMRQAWLQWEKERENG